MPTQARTTAGLLALLMGGALAGALSVATAAPPQDHPASSEAPLTDEQTQALVQRVLERQVIDDQAVREYDRAERSVTRGNGKDAADHNVLNRIIPTGANGQARVELERDGKATDPAELQRQWASAEQSLASSCFVTVQCTKEDTDRSERRRKETEEIIRSVGKAFIFRYAGRTNQEGRSVVQLSFVPNPAYHSSWRFEVVFAHSRGSAWVDPQSAQLVRLEATLSDDITFAAGLVAKVYRGARFTVEQKQVAPDVWLPTLTTYDFDGKKFIFGTLGLHERVEDSDYRHVGPPGQALALLRREHPVVALNDP